jgi:hypothetical protein
MSEQNQDRETVARKAELTPSQIRARAETSRTWIVAGLAALMLIIVGIALFIKPEAVEKAAAIFASSLALCLGYLVRDKNPTNTTVN